MLLYIILRLIILTVSLASLGTIAYQALRYWKLWSEKTVDFAWTLGSWNLAITVATTDFLLGSPAVPLRLALILMACLISTRLLWKNYERDVVEMRPRR